MAGTDRQGRLFAEAAPPDGVAVVNDRCLVRTRDEHRVVIVSGVVLGQYVLGDGMAEAHAMVMLVEGGWADQKDVARAFGYSVRTLRRNQQRFADRGLAGLGHGGGYPRGRVRVAGKRLRMVRRLKDDGVSNREVARRLGVNEKGVRKLLRRIGWQEKLPEQPSLPLVNPLPDGADPNLSAFSAISREIDCAGAGESVCGPSKSDPASADPNLSAFSATEPLPPSLDTDPGDRRMDRLLACLGLLDDAAPLFGSARRVSRAGVLLAISALVDSGVLAIARRIYGSIGPAFYGLRTTLVALLLMALLRIKRTEALKEHSPTDLGRLLGLDRAPEIKTLRRKLWRLASLGRAAEFGRALAAHRVNVRSTALGFLYVDGHVRVYHGTHRLPKAYVARRHLALPATTDYWVNDAVGEPLFVITAEANAPMTRMLPPILAEVRQLLGERRLTVAFDRGGFSARLFEHILALGFDLLTYRKGRMRRLPNNRFQALSARIDGRQLDYVLADQEVRLLKGRLRLRQVTRLCENGHQTPILTSRRDLSAVEVAYRMFERWRQENFFKYLREEYAIDALVDYGVVADDPGREVPNPKRKKLDAEIRSARAELAELRARYGTRAVRSAESRHRTLRGFKIAASELGRQMRLVEQRIRALEHRRSRLPKRVPVIEVVPGEVVKLAPERKHLTSLLKMVAYQAESDLVRLISPHYRRATDEARTLIQTALNSAADIEVTDTELRITLAPLSSAHRTRAVATLCEELNRNPTCFPGSRLRLRFAISDAAN